MIYPFSSLTAVACMIAAVDAATSGTLNVLTMNVAGLPWWLNNNDVPGDKATNAGTIGSKFAEYGYDIIHVQEDFAYHDYIYDNDNHPSRTSTSGNVPFGSGLNTLAKFPWTDFERVTWNKCYIGSGDCLTPKGFTFMRITVADGVSIDLYNLHTDAGTEDGDEEARRSNIQQVADYISANSVGNAVIVFGDTNSRYSRTADNILILGTQCGLQDSWVINQYGGNTPTNAPDCDNPSTTNTCETVDKVLYRGNDVLTLNAQSFSYEASKFLQPDGSILSDHNPISVTLTWSTNTKRSQSPLFGGPHGTWYNNLPHLPNTLNLKPTTISFRGNSRVDAVSLTLSTGETFTHGGTGGNSSSLTLADDEYWTSADVCQEKYKGHTRVFYIKATTSKGHTLTAGKKTSDCTTFTAPQDWQIVGFMGRSGDEVDRLGFIYAPQQQDPSTQTPPTMARSRTRRRLP